MISTTGSCPKCMALNSKSAVKCLECGERLPWAHEAEAQLRTQTQTAPKAQPATRPRPAKVPTMGDDDDSEWWQVVGWGLFLLAAAAFGFWRFSVMEATGGFRFVRWPIALLYSLGGKWLVLGIFGTMGVVAIIIGIMQYLQDKR